MNALTHGELFAGISGFGVGFADAGIQTVWQVEIDQKCQAINERHFPDVLRYGDVKNVGKENLAPVDVICGGFPCQDLSVAGRREGLAGSRSGLWFEFHRILGELRPQFTIIENVPGLLSSNGGADFAVILRGLAELGYLSAWRVLDAQYFGVAQRRRRVFIVGSLGDGRAAEILFEREGVPRNPAASRETGASVAASLTKGSAASRGVNSPGRRREDDVNLVVGALSAHSKRHGHAMTTQQEAESGHIIAFDWQSGGDVRHNISDTHTSALQSSQVPAVYQCHGNNVGPMGALRSGNSGVTGGVPFVAAFTERTRKQGRTFESQPELAYAPTNPGSGGTTHSRRVAGPFGVRRLTPTEAERLQGFDDGHTAGQSDSARYRQLGNAVCVNVARWIGHRIVEATK
jgi:DNA (cytosine-5)-methyltransferase 1